MKRILPIIMIIAFLASCASSNKLLREGRYDEAVNKSVKKLSRKPSDGEEIRILKKAYELANKNNTDAIERLKLSGQPDIWDAVLRNYEALLVRQEKVSRLPESVLQRIDYRHVDYNALIADSKRKAAQFYYASGKKLLEKGDRQSARQAYYELSRVKQFYPHYLDVDQLIEKALFMGTNQVLFKYQNQSRTVMPKDFENELMKITLKKLNKRWVNFDTYESKDYGYDYVIYLNLKMVDVSPESLKEIHYDEKKRVQDGFKYVLGPDGNVMKDTNGNDIKTPNYVDIVCHVKETQMLKKAIVSGTMDFYDNRTGQLIKTDRITAESVFEHRFAHVTGNLKAMTKKTSQIAKLRPVPFPNDLDLIYQTNQDLKKVAMDIIRRHRGLLEN
jgi:hypothetical protein